MESRVSGPSGPAQDEILTYTLTPFWKAYGRQAMCGYPLTANITAPLARSYSVPRCIPTVINPPSVGEIREHGIAEGDFKFRLQVCLEGCGGLAN